jgi:septum site-determining protein MinD
MARILVITSGKGGVGKTTSAINLAAAFNRFGKDVVIVDANLTTPNIGLHLGAPVVPVSISHVLSGKAELKDALYEHHSGIKVIPASLTLPRNIKPEKLNEIARKIKRLGEIIIFDSAAGLGKEALTGIQSADDILVVTQAELPAMTDALKAIKLANKFEKNIKGVILTRFKRDRYELPLENIESMLEIPILEIIPEDESVRESLKLKDAVVHTHPKSEAARAYRRLAAKILGPRYIKQVEKEDRKGTFYRILEKLGFKP